MDFQTLKGNMDEVFERILDKTNHGEQPELKDAQEFVRLCRLLHMQASEEWAAEAEDFAHLAEKFLQVLKEDDLQESVVIVESLDAAKDYCHRMFSL
ncbi:GAK system XXXCH domain-containing protein [Desulfobaculum bizertense]|uniref:GAK system XXXCH domain-containing protein n=1 Tax=Desulfobaculum bizertense TaxID=376490 RepID=UPI001F35BAC8|nr:GAK system XXXCH domain-containing protein [Desulfobaculum bizertense]UIJ37364.1 GAK system XXXCH domain-containing protein [Desulfobaculum bizertense]